MTILYLLLTISLVFNQNNHDLDLLRKNAENYYNIRDYSNAIILYEDLLVKQERVYPNYDPQIAETLNILGEMYSILEMEDIADYYYNQAIVILEYSLKLKQSQSEKILTNLLDIYALKNDSIKMNIIENKLSNMTSFFQIDHLNNTNMDYVKDSIYIIEDLAFDRMNKGLSYLDNGLFTEAASEFNSAFDLKSKNLNLQFFYDFFSNDSLINIQMSKAFKFQMDSDTTNASNFFLALFAFSNNEAYEYIQKFIIQDPSDSRAQLFLSNLFFKDKKWFEALYQFQKVLWINQSNIEALIGRGICLYNLNAFSDAILSFKKVIEIDNYNHIAYYYLGISLLNNENFDKSIESLTQALLLDPENIEAYFNLGKAYFQAGKLIQAKEAFNRTVNLDPQYGLAYYHLGLIYENSMDVQSAKQAYSSAWEYAPEIENIQYRLGMLLYRTGELKQAMEPLREFIINQPDSINVLKAMGEIFISESRFPEAIDTYNRLKNIYPEDLKINISLAESYYQLEYYEEAINVYTDILLFDDENYEIMNNMGQIFNDMGNFNSAEKIYTEIINCTIPNMSIYYKLAITFGNQGKFMSAILAFQEALNLEPNDIKIKYQLAVAYMEIGDFKNAAKYLENYVHNYFNDEIGFFLLGKCYFESEDYIAALLSLKKSNELSKGDHTTLYYMGRSLASLGEDLDAARTFREALKIKPEDPKIYAALCKSYYRLNKNKKVKETLDILNMLDRSLYLKLSSEIGLR